MFVLWYLNSYSTTCNSTLQFSSTLLYRYHHTKWYEWRWLRKIWKTCVLVNIWIWVGGWVITLIYGNFCGWTLLICLLFSTIVQVLNTVIEWNEWKNNHWFRIESVRHLTRNELRTYWRTAYLILTLLLRTSNIDRVMSCKKLVELHQKYEIDKDNFTTSFTWLPMQC